KADQRFNAVADFEKDLAWAGDDGNEIDVVVVDDDETKIKDDENVKVVEVGSVSKSRRINWKIIAIIAGIIVAGGLVRLLIDRSESKTGDMVPDPEYRGTASYDEEVVEEEEISEYDILLYKIRQCTSMDELEQLASDYSDFVSGLPQYQIDNLEQAAREKVTELTGYDYYDQEGYDDDVVYPADSVAVVEDYDYYGDPAE
ncbi:MAG: hypothetical protein K2K84_08775, partial [Muribaculaceae bacterium]|nr:hypothetical protein [Muribaculaceae bacterium]